jgi:hypothetical protein
VCSPYVGACEGRCMRSEPTLPRAWWAVTIAAARFSWAVLALRLAKGPVSLCTLMYFYVIIIYLSIPCYHAVHVRNRIHVSYYRFSPASLTISLRRLPSPRTQ